MKRNIEKAIEEGHVIVRSHNGLDLTVPELFEIMEKAEQTDSSREALYNAARYGYLVGLAVGYRNGKKGGSDNEKR